MWPISDRHPSEKFPLLTYAIIAVNIFVFMLELSVSNPQNFVQTYALIPSKVNFRYFESLTPFITSQFLHAGFFHIISNMWFLKIFGDNIEERLGKGMFLVLYLLSGVVGGLSQYLLAPSSDIPMLGASGAVAGVLGAYYVFFPKNPIRTFVLGFGFITTTDISASFMLLYWFATQLFSGAGSVITAATGGVAWFAHIGGFTIGYIISQIINSINIVEYYEDG